MSAISCHRAVLVLLAALLPVWVNAGSAVRFFAIGDIPYSESERALLHNLLEQELPKRPPFLVHVGDVKDGKAPCTDTTLSGIADLFRELPVPVVFTPGDNDWTDCRRPAAGGYDPGERLALLRRLCYSNPSVLRLSDLDVSAAGGDFPENYHFLYEGVLFAVVHVVGSHNNLLPKDPNAVQEYQARSEANRRHFERVATAAAQADATAIVLIFHANPGFESSSPPRGYRSFFADLERLFARFSGPVLAIHGDTHRYKLDHPYRDPETGAKSLRFTRLEVPGSPTVAGVWVFVDPASPVPFSAELAYPDARQGLIDD